MSEVEINLSNKIPLITEDELRTINNNFESIIKQFTGTFVNDKDLAIAQYIIKKQQEEIDKYKCKRNDCSGRLKENNKLTDSEILVEFEKWLEEKLLDRYANNDIARGYKNALKICLYKLYKLKDNKNER